MTYLRMYRNAIIAPSIVGVLFFSVWVSDCRAVLKIDGAVITAQDTAIYNILTNFGNDTLAVEIFNKMVASTETFSFDNTLHAKNHFKVRKEIVGAMNSMSPQGAIKFQMGPPFAIPSVAQTFNPKFPYLFEAKPTVKASDLLKAVESGTTKAECLTAVHCAMLIGHRRALGDAMIDDTFAVGALKVDGDWENFPFFQPMQDVNTLIPGDYMYMLNANDYFTEAIKKGTNPIQWIGENTIYVGTVNGVPKFSGLTLLNNTEAQIRERLRLGYNADTNNTLTLQQANTAIGWAIRMRIKIHSSP